MLIERNFMKSGSSSHNTQFSIIHNPQEFFCDGLYFHYKGLNSNSNFIKRRFYCNSMLSMHFAIVTFVDEKLKEKFIINNHLNDLNNNQVNNFRNIQKINLPDKISLMKREFISQNLIQQLDIVTNDIICLNQLRNAIVHNKKRTSTIEISRSNLFSSLTKTGYDNQNNIIDLKGRNLALMINSEISIQSVKNFVEEFCNLIGCNIPKTFTLNTYDKDSCS